jgi:S-(hydroxymethyl)glutathione dehydrogenase/alcohol dehydrogenase
MSVAARAAICHAPNAPMRIETIAVADPGEAEVMIRLLATGLCHTDLHFMEGHGKQSFPAVFGHEAIGRVIKCGPGVTGLAPGDMVLPYLLPDCGECAFCRSGKTNFCAQFIGRAGRPSPYTLNGQPIAAFMNIGAFSDVVVVPQDMVVRVPATVPPDTTCCIACGVTTGMGAVLLAAKVQAGETVAVFGAGGVGLSAIQGARIAGASRIFAVDTNPAKEAVARKLGATDFINPAAGGDAVAQIMQATGLGADYSFECAGNTKLMCQAIDAVNPAWGMAYQIGLLPPEASLSITAQTMAIGRGWTGSLMGGAKRQDVAHFVDLFTRGDIDLTDIVSHRLRLDDINEGFEMMRTGKSVRAVILFDEAAAS